MNKKVDNTMKISNPIDLDIIENIVKWIDSLGINFSNSRFGNAKRILEKWIDRRQKNAV